MLEMRGERAVDRPGRPAVGVGLCVVNDSVAAAALDPRLQLRTDLAQHRLDGQDHSLAQLESASALPIVVDLRLLVHPAADPVSYEIADHVETARLGVLLNRGADVAQVTS